MILIRTLITEVKNGFRIIQNKWAKNLISTAKQANNFGVDSYPPENTIAILADTLSKEEPVIIGYLYESALEDLKTGETCFYSTNEVGELKSTIKLRNDGTAELLGNTDNLIRYSKLKEEYDKTKAVLDAILTTLQAPINEPGNGAPSAFQAAMIAAVGEKTTGDISESKIDELKTI